MRTSNNTASLPVFTPTAAGAADLAARTVGREAVLSRITDCLRAAAETRDRPHVLVVGPRGSGKTHLLALAMHEVARDPALSGRLATAWMPEDSLELTSYCDLLYATVERLLDSSAGDQITKSATLERARAHRRASELLALEELIAELLEGRVLVLVIENLDRVFRDLGGEGQARLRSFMETSGEVLVLASNPLLFDAVSDHGEPWYGSFQVEHLGDLSPEEGAELVRRVAAARGLDDLVRLLETPEGVARTRAVAHLAGGSPRMWTVLAGCMSVERLEELVELVEAMLDELVPYYQQRLWELPGNERKIVAELCRTTVITEAGRTVHEQQGLRTVTDLAETCGLDQRVAASALGRLLEARWVRRTKPKGTDRRTTWYEIREPLLRHHLQYRETRGAPLRVIVGFLREWYARSEQHQRLSRVEPGSIAESYLRAALNESGRPEPSDAGFTSGVPDDLIVTARRDLDEAPSPHGRLLPWSAAAAIEAIALEARDGRGAGLRAARQRLGEAGPESRNQLASTIAKGLSAMGAATSPIELLTGDEFTPDCGPGPSESLSEARDRIARGLRAATSAADGQLDPSSRVALSLATAGWIGVSGQTATSVELLTEALPLALSAYVADARLRLAVEGELAYYLWESGARETAHELGTRVLGERTELLGANHPDALTSRANLAGWTGESGDPAYAQALYQEILRDHTRAQGPDHPATLITRGNHAWWTGESGDPARAQALYEHLLPVFETALGPDHPHTLTTRANVAWWTEESGDPARAQALYEQLLTDRERALGPDHPHTLATRDNLAFVLRTLDKPLRAALVAAPLLVEHGGASGMTDELMRAAISAVTSLPTGPDILRALVAGEYPGLPQALEVALRDGAGATRPLLEPWCTSAASLNEPALEETVTWLVELATRSGRESDLAASVVRAARALVRREHPVLPRWLNVWVTRTAGREDLAVAQRVLAAVEQAVQGEQGATLALPAEERRIVEEVLVRETGQPQPGLAG